MPSPLPALIHNAKLRFKVKRLGEERDRSGNPIPIYEVQEYIAFLKIDSKASNTNQPGIDINTMMVRGYLVDPQHFPLEVRNQSTCECEIWRGLDTVILGTLKLRPEMIPTLLISSVIGDRVSGILSVNQP